MAVVFFTQVAGLREAKGVLEQVDGPPRLKRNCWRKSVLSRTKRLLIVVTAQDRALTSSSPERTSRPSLDR
ncbi:hypothetical protein D3C78_1674380 [compost metagenome]